MREFLVSIWSNDILLIVFFLWACFAVRHQITLYGWSWWRIPLVAALNFVFCPLCIVIAILRGK